MKVNNYKSAVEYPLSGTVLTGPEIIGTDSKESRKQALAEETCFLLSSTLLIKSGYYFFFSVFAGVCFKRVDSFNVLFLISLALEAMVR